MATPSQARLRAFVRRHTELAPVADIPGVDLHLADDVMEVLRLGGLELGQQDPPLPYWAFPWPGGMAIACHLRDHPEEVRGLRILDMASGSGLCAIVAMRSGAASVLAVDVDPLSGAAVAVNARANHVRVGFSQRDLLEGAPPACDVILAGDVCYEETMANRMLQWLRLAANDGTRVLLGDPGRTYLPNDLERIATHRVRTSSEIHGAAWADAAVFTFAERASPAGSQSRRILAPVDR